MDCPSNIYKYNLEILKSIEDNQTIYYDDNKIFIDDRVFGIYRNGNNIVKISEIIKASFLHYFNLLQMDVKIDSENRNQILELLKNTINGIKILIITFKDMENESIQLEKLKLDLLSLLTEFNDNKDKFIDEYRDRDSDSDSESENCLRSMLNSTKEHLQMEDHNIIVNTIYIIKNKIVNTIIGVVCIIFDMASF